MTVRPPVHDAVHDAPTQRPALRAGETHHELAHEPEAEHTHGIGRRNASAVQGMRGNRRLARQQGRLFLDGLGQGKEYCARHVQQDAVGVLGATQEPGTGREFRTDRGCGAASANDPTDRPCSGDHLGGARLEGGPVRTRADQARRHVDQHVVGTRQHGLRGNLGPPTG